MVVRISLKTKSDYRVVELPLAEFWRTEVPTRFDANAAFDPKGLKSALRGRI